MWREPLPRNQPALTAEFFDSTELSSRNFLMIVGFVGAFTRLVYTVVNVGVTSNPAGASGFMLINMVIVMALLGMSLVLRFRPKIDFFFVFIAVFPTVTVLTGITSYLSDNFTGYVMWLAVTNLIYAIMPMPPKYVRLGWFINVTSYIAFSLVWRVPENALTSITPNDNRFQLVTIMMVIGSAFVSSIIHSMLLRQRWETFVASREVALLNARLQEHMATLEDVNQQLTQQNEDLNAFAHTVAHDLKTPLGAIVGYAKLLEEDFDDYPDVPDEFRLFLGHVEEAAHNATNIVQELLLLARIRQEEVALQPVEMEKVVEKALARLSYQLEQKGAQVHVEAHTWPTAVGYAPWLVEVWVNYLTNAIKYGGKPPHIDIGAIIQEQEAVFWVQDNGAGLGAEQQEQLFQKFSRLHEGIEGDGLGLTIVARIIHRLHGRVGLKSEYGRGSRFYFVLPLASG